MKFVRLAIAVALLCPVLARAAKDVTVVTDMTADGRKGPQPTAGHPVYYAPTLRGYQHVGTPISGEIPPSPHDVVRAAALELAKHGYLVVDAAHPTPDIVLDFAWGYIHPTSDAANGLFYNQGQAYSLTLGQTIFSVMPNESFNHQQFMDAANDTRYFLILTAYDYPAYARSRQHVQLWQSKMSVPLGGVVFNDILAALVRAGGPSFGRETVGHPKLEPAVPDGHVEVGEPTVKGYFAPPPILVTPVSGVGQ